MEADAKYRAAETVQDKLAALEEMLAVIPKHKGTEKMQADIKKRIAKLRQKEKSSAPSKKGLENQVHKEGAGQIAVAGPPNSGKSLLVSKLTAADPVVADYPFSTRIPLPGMMEYEDILIQLVDCPPIEHEVSEPWVASLIRNADAAVIVLDASTGAIFGDIENIKSELLKSKIQLVRPGESAGSSPSGMAYRSAIIAANKVDISGSEDNLEAFRELYESDLPIVPISAKTGEGLEELKESIWQLLGVVRVYTKIPGKHPDYESPFTLKRGSTVADLATMVHNEFAKKLRFARAWGKNKPDAAMVGWDHELEDKDVIELHV